MRTGCWIVTMLCSTSAIWGKALCADPVAAENRTQRARQTLLSGGWSGLEALVQEDAEQRTRQAQAAVEGLLDDLTPHQDHLHYAQRLASGQSSGSSQAAARSRVPART